MYFWYMVSYRRIKHSCARGHGRVFGNGTRVSMFSWWAQAAVRYEGFDVFVWWAQAAVAESGYWSESGVRSTHGRGRSCVACSLGVRSAMCTCILRARGSPPAKKKNED